MTPDEIEAVVGDLSEPTSPYTWPQRPIDRRVIKVIEHLMAENARLREDLRRAKISTIVARTQRRR